MEGLWMILLVGLVCPLVMGGMMFFMMRGMRGRHSSGRAFARPDHGFVARGPRGGKEGGL